jgi:eukaryotic-like serine/threonine-protein kinase
MVTDKKLDEFDLCGQVVTGRYRVLKKLGEGGMGTVYLAEHVTIEKKVALKVLLHEYARKQDLKDRFLQEAKAAAKIGHENIVDITDFGDTPDGSVFFCMEFLEGLDLSQLIRKQGPIPWSRSKPILLQICRALGAAHSKGIIHRDMKPENIYLIEREGRSDFVKVLDFGIAKMSMEGSGESRLTRTGMIFGTPEYMSPEQAQGNKPDHRVDVYAVGVIMYEMLTGHVPFKADTFMGILTKHIFEQPVSPSQANPGVSIPAEVEGLVLKALCKERDERFQSMAEMAAAITQASGRMTRPTGDTSVPPRILTASPSSSLPAISTLVGPTTTEVAEFNPARRARVIIGVLVAVVVLGGAVVVGLMLRKGDKTPQTKLEPKKAEPKKAEGASIPALSPDAGAAKPIGTQPRRVRIETTPSGASVYLDDKLLGKTPDPIELAPGDKTVTLVLKIDGYKDQTLSVAPTDQKLIATLDKLDPGTPPQPKVQPKKKKVELKVEPKKVEPKKAEPKKAEPKKAEPKKAEPKDPSTEDLIDPFKKQ